MSFRHRLTVWYAVLLTSVIILLGLLVYAVMRWTFITNFDRALEETIQEVNRSSRLAVIPTFGEASEIAVRLPVLDVFHASDVEVQVWILQDGAYVMTDQTADIANFTQPFDVSALGSAQQIFSDVRIDNISWRTITTPIYNVEGRLIGNIQAAGSLAMLSNITRDFLLALAACCVLTCVSSVVIVRWLTKRMLKPIDDLTEAAASVVRTNDLATRLSREGVPDDELGKLINVFNTMMGRLERLFGVQQRFVADISHELRTPLTSILGNVEMIQLYGADDVSVDAIASEASRMHRLVNDLLLLARADYGGLTIDMYTVELDTLVMEVFEQSRMLAKAKDISVSLVHLEPLQISGNSDRLKQTLLNLVDNAIKFTDENGKLTIGLMRRGDKAAIEVTDTGIGMSAEEIEHIFDRFYQSDPARTYNGTGFGLGLSIAEWIIKTHGGRIEVESEVGKGTTFRVNLPLAEADTDPSLTDTERLKAHNEGTRPRLPNLRRMNVNTKEKEKERVM
jgi:two-component system OmpR family sensor kinase